MKLGVFTALFGQRSLDDALDYIVASGLEAVEIGTGGYPRNPHCPIDDLLAGKAARTAWLQKITDRGLIVSALSCHNNPLHPNRQIAALADKTLRKTLRLAGELGIPVVNTFSGCPGDHDRAKYPNWVTCAWPPDFLEILDYQWNRKLIPYWTKLNAVAARYGVKIAFEAHPGMAVYNPATVLKLREAAGKQLGANFDPSHFFWQGIEPIDAVRALGPAIFHVHAKDTKVHDANTAVNGVLDVKPYGKAAERSWVFRTCGYGHGESWWRDFVSALRMVGYDYVLSIEHEDSLMSVNEGFQKAAAFLKGILLTEKVGGMWWV
jgi:sugar phosphate isomerase/epimerase